jgi:hypothetical protein
MEGGIEKGERWEREMEEVEERGIGRKREEEGRGKREEGREKREEGRGKRKEERGKRKEERGKRKGKREEGGRGRKEYLYPECHFPSNTVPSTEVKTPFPCIHPPFQEPMYVPVQFRKRKKKCKGGGISGEDVRMGGREDERMEGREDKRPEERGGQEEDRKTGDRKAGGRTGGREGRQTGISYFAI